MSNKEQSEKKKDNTNAFETNYGRFKGVIKRPTL